MRGHSIALWSGIFAFFSNIIAISLFDLFNPDEYVEYLTAAIVALITGGGVYAKQRLKDAREEKEAKEKKDVV